MGCEPPGRRNEPDPESSSGTPADKMPLKAVYLFGSHARGEARPDSDVDLCVVAEGAAAQLGAAQAFRRAMRPIRPKPAFTLVPIAPARLQE